MQKKMVLVGAVIFFLHGTNVQITTQTGCAATFSSRKSRNTATRLDAP